MGSDASLGSEVSLVSVASWLTVSVIGVSLVSCALSGTPPDGGVPGVSGGSTGSLGVSLISTGEDSDGGAGSGTGSGEAAGISSTGTDDSVLAAERKAGSYTNYC